MVITRLHCAGKSFRRYRNFSIRTSYVLQSPKRRGGHRLPLLFLSPFSACPMYAAPERRASPLIQRFLRAAHFARFLNQKPFTPTGGTGGSIQKPRWDNAPRSSLLCLLLRAKAFYPHRQNRRFYSKAARWDSAPRSSKLLRGAFWGHTLLYLRYLIRRSPVPAAEILLFPCGPGRAAFTSQLRLGPYNRTVKFVKIRGFSPCLPEGHTV